MDKLKSSEIMTWNAKELRRDNRPMWETLPDNKNFKPFRPIVIGISGVLILYLLMIILGRIDFEGVDKIANEYQRKLIWYAVNQPLDLLAIWAIFGVIGYAWLVKRAMQ